MTRGSTGTEIANRVYYFRKFFKPIVSLMIFIFPLVINKKISGRLNLTSVHNVVRLSIIDITKTYFTLVFRVPSGIFLISIGQFQSPIANRRSGRGPWI
jgi:hypothetical protein